MKHLLTLADLTKEELYDLLDLADSLKREVKKGVFTPYLRNKTLGMISIKSSTRTCVSFEAGMVQLGGIVLYLNANDMQLGRGKPIKDTTHVLLRYLDGIMIRIYKHSDVEEPAEHGSIPIINGLTNHVYPCQVLADLQTTREHKGTLMGLRMCSIGAGSNMANSLINGGILADIEVACTCPLEYLPDEGITKRAQASGRFTLTQSVPKAVRDADALVMDVRASMGEEQEAAQRRKISEGIYQINDACMAVAKMDAMALHCPPAHREEEITEKVFEAHAGKIFNETGNRLRTQKVVLATLLKDRSKETDGEAVRFLFPSDTPEHTVKSNT